MMKNPDGTPYSFYTIADIIEDRFCNQEYPYLSDLLGSDWGVGLGIATTSEAYKWHALAIAKRIYKD